MKFWVAAMMAGGVMGAASLPVRAECSNPDALGVSRVMPVSVADGPVGLASYKRTLALDDHEVVLTFDDGPIANRTPAVLKALERECVKATFFTVGVMAAAYPKLVQETAQAGHTIGTHTWSHRYLTQRRNRNAADFQIGGGLHAANVALGEEKAALSPFFRFPGLNHNKRLDAFVAENGLISVSVDIVGDDWLFITPDQVLQRTMARLEQKKKGIILLHDIQNRTVQMLPALLRQLKERGYRVVHIVPDETETRVALAKLGEPQSRSFQIAMARTRTKIAKLGAPDLAPVPGFIEPVEKAPSTRPLAERVASIEAAPAPRPVAFARVQAAPPPAP
ncbi:MAG: polysaccharide deacetylase family protein [Xanthobacteraceae bacterium]|nr:polysaccharide deacetylase family protein [Xanthobacteraceae bacterium]MBY0611668.1 polysaccharide deacetylase family protein [Beijerinckiaceae bacterium]